MNGISNQETPTTELSGRRTSQRNSVNSNNNSKTSDNFFMKKLGVVGHSSSQEKPMSRSASQSSDLKAGAKNGNSTSRDSSVNSMRRRKLSNTLRNMWPFTKNSSVEQMVPPKQALKPLTNGIYRFECPADGFSEDQYAIHDLAESEKDYIKHLESTNDRLQKLYMKSPKFAESCSDLVNSFAKLLKCQQNALPFILSGFKDASGCDLNMDPSSGNVSTITPESLFGKHVFEVFLPLINEYEVYIAKYASFYYQIEELIRFSGRMELELNDLNQYLIKPLARVIEYRYIFYRIIRNLKKRNRKSLGNFEACMRRFEYLVDDAYQSVGMKDSFQDIVDYEEGALDKSKIGPWKGFTTSKNVHLLLTKPTFLGQPLPCSPVIKFSGNFKLVPGNQIKVTSVSRSSYSLNAAQTEKHLGVSPSHPSKLKKEVSLVLLSDTLLILKREKSGITSKSLISYLMYPPIPLALVEVDHISEVSSVMSVKVQNEVPMNFCSANRDSLELFVETLNSLKRALSQVRNDGKFKMSPSSSPIKSIKTISPLKEPTKVSIFDKPADLPAHVPIIGRPNQSHQHVRAMTTTDENHQVLNSMNESSLITPKKQSISEKSETQDTPTRGKINFLVSPAGSVKNSGGGRFIKQDSGIALSSQTSSSTEIMIEADCVQLSFVSEGDFVLGTQASNNKDVSAIIENLSHNWLVHNPVEAGKQVVKRIRNPDPNVLAKQPVSAYILRKNAEGKSEWSMLNCSEMIFYSNRDIQKPMAVNKNSIDQNPFEVKRALSWIVLNVRETKKSIVTINVDLNLICRPLGLENNSVAANSNLSPSYRQLHIVNSHGNYAIKFQTEEGAAQVWAKVNAELACLVADIKVKLSKSLLIMNDAHVHPSDIVVEENLGKVCVKEFNQDCATSIGPCKLILTRASEEISHVISAESPKNPVTKLKYGSLALFSKHAPHIVLLSAPILDDNVRIYEDNTNIKMSVLNEERVYDYKFFHSNIDVIGKIRHCLEEIGIKNAELRENYRNSDENEESDQESEESGSDCSSDDESSDHHEEDEDESVVDCADNNKVEIHNEAEGVLEEKSIKSVEQDDVNDREQGEEIKPNRSPTKVKSLALKMNRVSSASSELSVGSYSSIQATLSSHSQHATHARKLSRSSLPRSAYSTFGVPYRPNENISALLSMVATNTADRKINTGHPPSDQFCTHPLLSNNREGVSLEQILRQIEGGLTSSATLDEIEKYAVLRALDNPNNFFLYDNLQYANQKDCSMETKFHTQQTEEGSKEESLKSERHQEPISDSSMLFDNEMIRDLKRIQHYMSFLKSQNKFSNQENEKLIEIIKALTKENLRLKRVSSTFRKLKPIDSQ